MTTPLHIAVIGAGIAGMSVAILLSRHGHRVTVFERRQPSVPQGAGLLLQPVGLDALRALGLLASIESQGTRIDRICRVDTASATAFRVVYPSGLHDHAVGIRRPALYRSLWNALTNACTDVRSGVCVHDIATSDGATWLTLDDGGKSGPYDVIVVSDGVHSRLRLRVTPSVEVARREQGALSVDVLLPAACDPGQLLQIHHGHEEYIGVLPTGVDERGKHRATLFINKSQSQVEALERGDFDAWRLALASKYPELHNSLDGLTGFDALQHWSFAHVRMQTWHTKHLVCIGDAAHAFDPQLGMGANMALADAITLAAALRLTGAPQVPIALAAYQAARESQLRTYETASRTLSTLADSAGAFGAAANRLASGFASKLPFVKRRIVHAVCGYAGLEMTQWQRTVDMFSTFRGGPRRTLAIDPTSV
ncbi:FAD-dependent oxidoreductase [Steroidobacter flavus]|uniref:FAD-dependent oxidoreductase n=1 Tax=Steroidobacter flavus TaxID=1842136 RepID=A0ABV8T010_9GAMM